MKLSGHLGVDYPRTDAIHTISFRSQTQAGPLALVLFEGSQQNTKLNDKILRERERKKKGFKRMWNCVEVNNVTIPQDSRLRFSFFSFYQSYSYLII